MTIDGNGITNKRFDCPCGSAHDIALKNLSLDCAAYERNGVDLCRLDVAEGLHKQIIDVALVADRIEQAATTMVRISMHAADDGDKAGATRRWCIAAREYDWAAQLWDAIGMADRAAKCRDKAIEVRGGDHPLLAARKAGR